MSATESVPPELAQRLAEILRPGPSSVTRDLADHVVAKVDRAMRDAIDLCEDTGQGFLMMLGVLAAVSGACGGAATALLDLSDAPEDRRTGTLLALAIAETAAGGQG